MKCPLTTVISTVERSPKAEDWGDCIKEECAWWDGDTQSCAISQLHKEICDIRNLVVKLLQKMLHEEQ